MTSDKNDRPAQGQRDAPDTDPLALYLDAAKANPPELSTQLRARILADAQTSRAPLPQPPRSGGTWRSWFSGWAVPGVAGGAAVAVAGFWIGVSLPIPVLALDAPQWVEGALGYMDLIAVQVIGLDDPLLMEF